MTVVFPRFRELLIGAAEDQAVRAAQHLVNFALPPDFFASGEPNVRAADLSGQFLDEVQDLTESYNLWKIKLFSPAGEVIYSTDPADVGTVNQYPYFQDIVAAGKPYSKLIQRETPTEEDQYAQVDVVETYVPVMQAGRFAGAFEIYYDISDEYGQLNSLLRQSSITTAILALGLLALVILVTLRSGRVMLARQQVQSALEASERRYRDLFNNSPISLWEEDFSEVKRAIDQLRAEGVTDFAAYFDEHPEAVKDCLSRVVVLDVNQATLDLFKARDKQALLDNLDRVFTPDALPLFQKELVAIADGGMVFESEGLNRSLGDDLIDISLRWSVAPGYEHSLGKVFVSISDITGRKTAERMQQAQSDQMEILSDVSRALVEASLEIQPVLDIVVKRAAELIGDVCVVSLLDSDGQYLDTICSHHAVSEHSHELGELLINGHVLFGGGISGLVARSGVKQYLPELDQAAKELQAAVRSEYRQYLEKFEIHSLLVVPLRSQGRVIGTLSVWRDRPGRPYQPEHLVFLSDLADRAALAVANARLHAQVADQARRDSLTGLFNRRYFTELAQREFSRARRSHLPLSVILFDLDHFKKINDSYGHSAGDQALQVVAQICSHKVRDYDILARYGGEEFVVLLPEADMTAALGVAERLRRFIRETPVAVSGASVNLSVSLGVAQMAEDTPDLDALLNQADAAMYIAKQSGRDRVEASPISSAIGD